MFTRAPGQGRARRAGAFAALAAALCGAGCDPAGGLDAGLGGTDAGRAVDAGPRGTCPPAPPFGTDTGDYGPNVSLDDCDGVAHSLFGLCEEKASWLFAFASH